MTARGSVPGTTEGPDRTIACEDRDFVEWHGGCEHALVWAVEADAAPVRAAVASARERWSDVLLPRHLRQPHITVAYAGPVPAPGATPVDAPYTRERFVSDLERLRAVGVGSFTVRVGGWDTFPMVPYLPAAAPELARLNAALTQGSPHDGGYVPHVTIGHYAVSRPMDELRARAAGWRAPRIDPLEVAEISLLAYATRDIAGPLTTVGRLRLADGAWLRTSLLPGFG